jgi:hypothetical protein
MLLYEMPSGFIRTDGDGSQVDWAEYSANCSE